MSQCVSFLCCRSRLIPRKGEKLLANRMKPKQVNRYRSILALPTDRHATSPARTPAKITSRSVCLSFFDRREPQSRWIDVKILTYRFRNSFVDQDHVLVCPSPPTPPRPPFYLRDHVVGLCIYSYITPKRRRLVMLTLLPSRK